MCNHSYYHKIYDDHRTILFLIVKCYTYATMGLFLKHVQPTKGDGLAIARATMLVKIIIGFKKIQLLC
jgi:hypothetical protein